MMGGEMKAFDRDSSRTYCVYRFELVIIDRLHLLDAALLCGMRRGLTSCGDFANGSGSRSFWQTNLWGATDLATSRAEEIITVAIGS